MPTNPKGNTMTNPKPDLPPKEPRDLLDGSKPFLVLLHQTPSKDNHRVFDGPDQGDDIIAAANVIAGRGGTAFILRPVQVFTPPKEPVVETKNLDFSPTEADAYKGAGSAEAE